MLQQKSRKIDYFCIGPENRPVLYVVNTQEFGNRNKLDWGDVYEKYWTERDTCVSMLR
jgi:hypothetical protein